MISFSLNRRKRRGEPAPVNGHDLNDHDLNGACFESLPAASADTLGERTIKMLHYRPAKNGEEGDKLPGRLLAVAGVVVAAALIGAGIVAYEAQRLFALAHNHTAAITDADHLRAVIVGALPDAGWVAMALVALVAALRGQSSLRARVGVLIFFALSLGAQVLYAPRTPEGMLVAVIAPVTMAWMLETFIVEVRRWASARRSLAMDETPILTGVLLSGVRLLRGLLRLLLWVVRLLLSPRSTGAGLREWILDTAPIAPGRSVASMRAAEAAARADSAHATVEQVRAAAAEERAALEAKARTDHETAEQERRRLVDEAAEQLARAQREAADHVAALREEAAREVARARQDAERRVQSLAESTAAAAGDQADRMADLEKQLDAARGDLDRAGATAARLPRVEQEARTARGDLEAARLTLSTLQRYAGARAVLRTRYEALRTTGDHRYGDRDHVADLAREWAPAVGVSEATARRYLTEHLTDPTADVGPEGEY